MMADTVNLILPLMEAAQNQKHVTHNEALRLLDGLVQLSVKDRDRTAPPGSPADGARYLVASGASGAWSGWDGNIAFHVDGAWMRLVPREGWRLWVEDEDALLAFNGTSWIVPPVSNLGQSKIFVTLPSAQPVPANTWTKIAFSTVFFDVGGDFDAAGTQRFTAPAAGHYLAVIGFTHQDTAGTPSLMRGGFGINGANPANYARSSVANPVSLASQLEFTTLLSLAAGDTVAGMVYFQGTGASIPGPNLARMSIARLP